jgi:hypothetical protein
VHPRIRRVFDAYSTRIRFVSVSRSRYVLDDTMRMNLLPSPRRTEPSMGHGRAMDGPSKFVSIVGSRSTRERKAT